MQQPNVHSTVGFSTGMYSPCSLPCLVERGHHEMGNTEDITWLSDAVCLLSYVQVALDGLHDELLGVLTRAFQGRRLFERCLQF